MADKKKKFGASGLNALSTALNTVSEAVEKAETTPVQPSVPEPPQPAPPVETPAYEEPEKSLISEEPSEPKKDTVGVNIILPREAYRRLQNMRIDLDNIPLRSLCLQLVLEGMDRYERKRR